MAIEATQGAVHEHTAAVAAQDEHGPVHHQFEDIEQQNESYIVGMWAFLVTEIMFFGALFLAYAVYRWKYPLVFIEAHKMLDIPLGLTNTFILLTSSFFVVLAVHYHKLNRRKLAATWLFLTVLCAFGFLVIKGFEYGHKFKVGHVPGPNFTFELPASASPEAKEQVTVERAQLFFGLYFAMTGLHGIHVLVGILILTPLAFMILKGHHHVVDDYIPTEMAALYWHFVDVVWIFLFPLFYLIPLH